MAQGEVARLMQQIAEEYQAAKAGLSGLAAGVSRHDFIQVRMENMNCYHQQLSTLVGREQAVKMVAETIEHADIVE
jgi:hypothetical protein